MVVVLLLDLFLDREVGLQDCGQVLFSLLEILFTFLLIVIVVDHQIRCGGACLALEGVAVRCVMVLAEFIRIILEVLCAHGVHASIREVAPIVLLMEIAEPVQVLKQLT